MIDREEAIIEAMARAMCFASGSSPDMPIIAEIFGPNLIGEPKWKAYRERARGQRVAHLAMIEAEKRLVAK